jgi:inosose dehydratase
MRTHWQVGNAPCSWGTIENTGSEEARVDPSRFLDELTEAGYAGTELGDEGFLPSDANRLRAELQRRGLALTGSWVTVRLDDPDHHEASAQRAVRVARLLREVGGEDAVINLGPDHSRVPHRTARAGRIRPDDGLEESGWRHYTEGAELVARAVRDDTGLRCAFHAHGASWVETPAEIGEFLDRTDAELVGLCFDTGHVSLGGGDPVEVLRSFAQRVTLVHLKDFDPSVLARADAKGWGYPELIRYGVFPELGRGVVDFPAVLDELRRIDYRGWLVVEQDVLPGQGDPLAANRRNRTYLQGLGL